MKKFCEWVKAVPVHTLLRFGVYGLVAYCLFVPFYFTSQYGFNFPMNPDDSVVSLAQVPFAGGDGEIFSYLTTTKNGHPHIMQRTYTLLGFLARGEVDFIWLNLAALTGVMLFTLWVGVRSGSLGFLLLSAALIPSYSHNIFNWISASGAYSYAYIYLFLAACLVARPGWRVYPLLQLVSVLCVMSFGNGILIVPCMLVLMGIFKWKDPEFRLKDWTPMGVTLILCILVYKRFVESGTDVGEFLEHLMKDPMTTVWFVMEMCGSLARYVPLGLPSPVAARVFACLLFLIPPVILWFRRVNMKEAAPYLGLWIMTCGSSIAAAMGRAYTADGSGMAPRYEFLSVFLLFGVCGLIWHTFSGNRFVWLRSGVLILILVLVVFRTQDQTGYRYGRYRAQRVSSDLVFSGILDQLDLKHPQQTTGRVANALRIQKDTLEAVQRGVYRHPYALKDSAWIMRQAATPERVAFINQLTKSVAQGGGRFQVGIVHWLVPEVLEWRAMFKTRTGEVEIQVIHVPQVLEVLWILELAKQGPVPLLEKKFTLKEVLDDDTLWLETEGGKAQLLYSPEFGACLLEVHGDDPAAVQAAQTLWGAAAWDVVSR